jgi:hypothetical protein
MELAQGKYVRNTGMGGYLHGMGACLHGPRIDQTEYWLRHN